MILEIILFILGLIILVKGADFFVKSSSNIAKKLGVSELIIGLTLVAIGTSIPELANAILASINKNSGLILGNVLGANIANIALIVGVAALIGNIKTRKEMITRDGYIMVFVFVIFYLFLLSGKITRNFAAIFLLFYVAYILFLFQVKKKAVKKQGLKEFLSYFLRFKYIVTIKDKIIKNNVKNSHEKQKIKNMFRAGIIKDILVIIISIFAIFVGAHYVIKEAIFFANYFSVSSVFLGIIIAIGTTLPELSVSINAAKKNLGGIVIGNVIGGCITNLLLILGVAGFIFPLSISKITIYYIAPVMIFLSFLLLFFLRSDYKFKKAESIIFIIIYFLFLIGLLGII